MRLTASHCPFILVLIVCGSIFMSTSSSAACDCGSSDSSAPCFGENISVTVNGDGRSNSFNWAFNSNGGPAHCGQFANGDYWVAPAPSQSSVTVSSITGSGGSAVFADENPVPEGMGFLGHDYGNLLVKENIISSLPKSYNYRTSLVAAIERNQATSGDCGTRGILSGCIDSYNAVTILTSVPENAGATVLRPNLIRADKELMSLSEFNLDWLPKKDYFDGTDAEGLESIRSTWAHHIEIFSMRDREKNSYSEGGRAFRADLVTDDYAATVAAQWHDNLSRLMSSAHSQLDVTPALASMLTYAKDIYYHVYDFNNQRDRWFGVGAGQSMGRFPSAAFFAAMARDNQYGNALKLAANTQTGIGGHSVQELDQINIGPNGPVWGDGDDEAQLDQYNVGRYWGEMLTGQNFNNAPRNDLGKKTGQRTMRDPYRFIDGPGQFPGVSYAAVTAGPTRALAAEMILMPRMCEFVNYDELVEYSIRLTTMGRMIDNDPCAPPDPRELNGAIIQAMQDANVPGADSLLPCDTYRAKDCRYYGLSWDPDFTAAPTWGPDPADRNRCIMNGVDPLSDQPQTGRFTNADAQAREFDVGYKVLQIETNWSAITAGVSSCRTVVSAAPKPPIDFQVVEQ